MKVIKSIVVAFAVIAVIGIEGCSSEIDLDNNSSVIVEDQQTEEQKDIADEESIKEIINEASEITDNIADFIEENSFDEEIFDDSSMTLGQKNALGSAKSYLSFTAFSYLGLINQLEFEGYTNEEATYAADNCGADWNEQALKSAISYLETTAFSYKGLIEQLEFEQYTSEQAKYGADNCEADWNEQAAKSAKSYLDISEFSRSGLIEQLEFEGYTSDQAVFGVTAVGY